MFLKNSLRVDNALFNCSKIPENFINDGEMKESLKICFASLKDTFQVDQKSIRSMKVTENQVVFTTFEKKEFVIDHKVASIAQPLLFQRDLVGERIVQAFNEKKISNLYFYSSGGGGHKSAKEAEMVKQFEKLMEYVKFEVENDSLSIDIDFNQLDKGMNIFNDERLNSPEKCIEWCKKMEIVQDIDVMHDFLGEMGVWATDQWDKAQQAGDVKKQEGLASKQWLSDFIFGPIIFLSTVRNLIKYKPKQIVSTQAMATPSILLAIKLYNVLFKPSKDEDVQLHLYMTDLPTEFAQHFFNSLKRSTIYNIKDYIVLYVPKVEEGTDWKKLCGLTKEQVKELDIEELPVRREFIKAVNEFKIEEERKVHFKVGNGEELKLLNEVIQFQDKRQTIGNDTLQGPQIIDYKLQAEDEATFIMLGSQPEESAIKAYIQESIELAEKNPEIDYHLFVYTGKFEKYKDICSYIKEQPHWPPRLRVVPFSYQAPKEVVSLELMCDTKTRSGGATTMELLVLNEVYKKNPTLPGRKRMIHAKQMEGRSLEDSIPLWEKGNYLFLKKHIQASVVEPQKYEI